VVDASKTGFNDCLRKLFVRYSAVDDVVKYMTPGCRISKIDLADAFFVRPVDATECDFIGVQHETSKEYFRYRFMPFGVASSPFSMQRLAVEIKRVLNKEGLRHVAPRLANGGRNPAADLAGFRCAAAYLDDFALVHPAWLTKEQADEQYASVLQVMQSLGRDLVKVEKCEWPSERCEFLGITLDSVAQLATVSAERAEKLRDLIDLTLADLPGVVTRKRLASVIGKLQFVAPYIQDGQALLAPLYASRDAFTDPSVAGTTRAWHNDTTVAVGPAAVAALTRLRAVLVDPAGRRVFLKETGAGSAFWRASNVIASDSEIDATSTTEHGIDVITTDASGYAGGAWWRHKRMRYDFTEAQASPRSSSNWRELHTIVQAVKLWAPSLHGRRLLIRTDNSTCVSVIRRRNSSTPELRALYLELSEICRAHGIEIAARHIAGVDNTLSDALSRWHHRYDNQDWSLGTALFSRWNALLGQHDVDAACDPEGCNSQLPRFWSEADDALGHDWTGLNVWCNPPFDQAASFLRKALEAHALCPETSGATFVLPDWPWAPWYKLLAHFEVVHRYGAGCRLFTAPERHEGTAASGARVDRGPTRWPVLILRLPHLSPTLRRLGGAPHRAGAGGPARRDGFAAGPTGDNVQRVLAGGAPLPDVCDMRPLPLLGVHPDVRGPVPNGTAVALLGLRVGAPPWDRASCPPGRRPAALRPSAPAYRVDAFVSPALWPGGAREEVRALVRGDAVGGAAGAPRRHQPVPAAPAARGRRGHLDHRAGRAGHLGVAC
jgi:hypothetical protein